MTQNPVEGSPCGNAGLIVALDRVDRDLYRNRFSESSRNHLFGGQVMAQGLAAACDTVEPDRSLHSLHGYFLRAGVPSQRIIFHVERTRDGGRFCTRRIVAAQDGTPIFHMECSFHKPEPSFEHQSNVAPDVPLPDDLPQLSEIAKLLGDRLPDYIAKTFSYDRVMDLRFTDPEQVIRQDLPARRRFWLRIPSAADEADPMLHQQLLAYQSDFWLAMTALVPHPVRMAGPDLFMTSLDHALWLHRPHRVDEWLLCDYESPCASDGRGFVRGQMFDREGRLVASVSQEALMRPLSG